METGTVSYRHGNTAYIDLITNGGGGIEEGNYYGVWIVDDVLNETVASIKKYLHVFTPTAEGDLVTLYQIAVKAGYVPVVAPAVAVILEGIVARGDGEFDTRC